jgi:hypothetical protein
LSVGAVLSGSGADLLSPADDSSVDLSNPFQVANCSLLGFKPRLSLSLKGDTVRGAHPSLTTVLRPRANDANIGKAVVALPRSELLDQTHIKTVCTKVQFAANKCPKGSIYGSARAITPLLDTPLEGPVYLRSSENPLPDLVARLRGLINLNVAGRIDSVRGGLRTTFAVVPDAPLKKMTLTLQGGEKGLLVNSRNLCLRGAHADGEFTAQNGKFAHLHPRLVASCGPARKAKRHR